jgi:hypothetical protein
MKRLILASLSALFLASTYTSAATAQHVAINSTTLSSSPTIRQLTPFNLVSLANQGYFQSQGIPSSGGLIAAYSVGRVTAEDIVRSAVATHWLPSQVLSDRGYMSAVNAQLNDLEPNR